ncbi:MAG: aldo/keto reductase [Steroidobacteraceae bacterium]|jgi:aryl-alcohol dehydrogenase-like predicted oxidoreductase|nr:aldo/keto reductase [Steroidobacteraceae bacterium]
MKQRALGRQGLVVPAIGLGTMGMTGVAGMPEMYGAADEAEGIATIHRALELGVNFFDTAEVYGPYSNEELLGRALAGRRHEAIIATKFGFRIVEGRIAGQDSRPENVRAALEGCLRRLGTDHVDLWYQHRLDRSVPIEETVGVMAEQVKAGKVRYLGLSEVGVDTIRRAHAVHPISALQSEYSLWERNLEAPSPGGQPAVLQVCRELGIGIVPYSPLGRGFLTGTVARAEQLPERDYRRHDPRYVGDNYDRNQRLLEAVRSVAARRGAEPAQVALAWLLQRGEDVVPIPGTKRRRYLEVNAAAAELALEPADLATIDAAGPVSGARYTERSLATIDR